MKWDCNIQSTLKHLIFSRFYLNLFGITRDITTPVLVFLLSNNEENNDKLFLHNNITVNYFLSEYRTLKKLKNIVMFHILPGKTLLVICHYK